jgi:hypothetical protein
MSELKTVVGDATNPQIGVNEVAIIPHVCNNKNRWGAGFVLALNKKWKEPQQAYRELFKGYPDMKGFPVGSTKERFEKSVLGTCHLVQVEPNIFVLNMIAQDGTGREGEPERPLKYAALTLSMTKALDRIDNKIRIGMIKPGTKISFHAPMFGSGLAGGNFNYIKELIQEIWVDNGYDVTVYEFPK